MAQCAGELLAPGRQFLPLPCIDQVERHALKIALSDGERGKRLRGCVHTAERFEARIVERLHAKRHAVDACGAVAGEAPRLDGCRVGLSVISASAVDGPKLGDVVEDRRDGLRRHQQQRTAAEEDAADRASPARAWAKCFNSVRYAPTKLPWSMAPWRTCELKSRCGCAIKRARQIALIPYVTD